MKFIRLAFMALLVWLTTPALTLAAPEYGEPVLDPASTPGLHVWRTSDGWKVRFMADDSGPAKIALYFTASKSIEWVSHVELEESDRVALIPEDKTLGLSLNVSSLETDGVDFGLSPKADLCLYSIGEAFTVFLGGNSTPLTTPADVSQSSDCGTPAVQQTRKYHPGHYAAMNRFDSTADMNEVMEPGIRGVQWRFLWSELEPSLGNYDFSRVQRDLAFLASQNRQLVLLIEDKTFKNEIPTPVYLRESHTLATRQGGYIAKRWDPYVVSRMKALLQALGGAFDTHPNFEGVGIQESALSLDEAVLNANGYTPERYRDSLREVLTSATQHFPSSRVFWYMNFLVGNQSYLGDIATAVAPLGVVMGGPDVLPDSEPLQTHTYPLYDRFQTQMKLFGAMQYDSYAHVHSDTSASTKYWTLDEMFRYARDNLQISYLFWNRKTWRKPLDSYDWSDAVPVINNHQTFNQ